MDTVSEQERQAILAEQAPRVAEAEARVANPEPMDPSIIEKLIMWLRAKAGGAKAAVESTANEAGEPIAVEARDVAGGLAARKKLEAEVQQLLRER